MLDLGLEVAITINRPLAVGARLTLQLANCDPDAAALSFADVPAPPVEQRPPFPVPHHLHVAAATFAPAGLPFSPAYLPPVNRAFHSMPRAHPPPWGRRWPPHQRCY